LREDGEVLPHYVRKAEADSFLATEHPDKALRIYKELLAADPKNFVLRRFLFFAQIESEDFNSGFETIDALARNQAPGIRLPLQVAPIENPDWLEARILVGQGRQYASMESEAWKRLLPLAEGAPALGYLRANMGSVAADRGWPRLADEEIEIAAELAAEDRGVEIRLAESCLERKRFREAHKRVQNLYSLFPDDPPVQRLVRDLAAHDAVELQVDTQVTHESGNAANRPGSEFETSARLYSPPFAERWRALAGFEYSSAQPPEGFVDRIRYGAGAQAQWPDFSLEAIAWNNTGTLSRAGGSLNSTWEPTDHWSLSAGGELYSSETPLRAVLHGITANSASFRASYAQNESFSISGGIGAYLFSDGNQRLEGSLSTVRRLITRPHLKVTIRPEFYASHNTRPDAPYFNPLHDEAASVVLRANHVFWRHYERSLQQSVELGAGPYWEAHFRPDWTGQIAYRQTFQINPGLELRYGVDFARRVYDGQPVRDFGAIVSLNKRLGS
jgi:biofilm PGA synthesis protein PgaA